MLARLCLAVIACQVHEVKMVQWACKDSLLRLAVQLSVVLRLDYQGLSTPSALLWQHRGNCCMSRETTHLLDLWWNPILLSGICYLLALAFLRQKVKILLNIVSGNMLKLIFSIFCCWSEILIIKIKWPKMSTFEFIYRKYNAYERLVS